MCFRRGNFFAYHPNWIEKSTLIFKPQEDSYAPMGHLDKPGQAHSLVSTIFHRKAKKDQNGWDTSFDCGSTLLTSRRMFETHADIPEQDFAKQTRVSRTFQVERKYVQQHNGQRTQLAKGLQVLDRYG